MKRTSLAILAILLCAVSFGVFYVGFQRGQYPVDRRSFCKVLASKIRSGQTLDEVQSELGPGYDLSVGEHSAAAEALVRWQQDEPLYYADGIEEHDEFKRWRIPNSCTLQLQFRAGRLINHAPGSYEACAK